MLIFFSKRNKFIINSHESNHSVGASGGPAVAAAEVQFLELGESLHRDERGFAYFPFQNLPDSLALKEMCGNCHLISIEPGHLRGQHRHPGKTEWLLLFHGMGQLYWRTADGQVHQRLLNGLQTLVVIPPGIPHTLRNDGTHPLYLLAWRAEVPAAGDAADTVPDYVI
jgi:hypothetical protein